MPLSDPLKEDPYGAQIRPLASIRGLDTGLGRRCQESEGGCLKAEEIVQTAQ